MFAVLLLVSTTAVAQEDDGMYFNSQDREKTQVLAKERAARRKAYYENYSSENDLKGTRYTNPEYRKGRTYTPLYNYYDDDPSLYTNRNLANPYAPGNYSGYSPAYPWNTTAYGRPRTNVAINIGIGMGSGWGWNQPGMYDGWGYDPFWAHNASWWGAHYSPYLGWYCPMNTWSPGWGMSAFGPTVGWNSMMGWNAGWGSPWMTGFNSWNNPWGFWQQQQWANQIRNTYYDRIDDYNRRPTGREYVAPAQPAPRDINQNRRDWNWPNWGGNNNSGGGNPGGGRGSWGGDNGNSGGRGSSGSGTDYGSGGGYDGGRPR